MKTIKNFLVVGLVVGLMLSFSAPVNSQIKGIDLKNVSSTTDKGTLQKTGTGSTYLSYKLTPVGLKKCMEKARELLAANDILFTSTTSNRSLIDSAVDDLYDYEMLHATLLLGYSEIKMRWKINGESMSLMCDDKQYIILFMGL